MPYPAENIDSIGLEYLPQWEIWMVKLYALEPPTEDFYMFNGYVNGKIITDSVSRKNISDDRLFNGNYTSGATVMVVRDNEIEEGDIFTLELSNITKSYAEYMSQLQTELQPNDPLFSGPPANVSSNITNDAVGYFACYPSKFSSTIAKVTDRKCFYSQHYSEPDRGNNAIEDVGHGPIADHTLLQLRSAHKVQWILVYSKSNMMAYSALFR